MQSRVSRSNQKNLRSFEQKINQDDIYDDLVKRLFKDRLHKASANHIVFARRGKTPREEALQQAINQAKKNKIVTYQIEHETISTNPSLNVALVKFETSLRIYYKKKKENKKHIHFNTLI